MNTSANTFDIRNFIDALTPTKTKEKYICPVCQGNDLGVDSKTGAYSCFHGCECKDIREALAPWKDREQNSGKKVIISLPKKSAVELVPLPQGELAIARLSEIPNDIPKPTKAQVTAGIFKTLSGKGCTPEEIKQTTVITYDYGDGKASYRFQAPCSKSSKGHEKTFFVSHTDDRGVTISSKGNDKWKAYRQDEAVAAALAVEVGKVPVILVYEGEKCVEAARGERITSITAQGTASEKDWKFILKDIKAGMGERSFIIAYCPDNDDAGIQKAEAFMKAAILTRVAFVPLDLKSIKPDLQDKGDIADILGDGMTGDELVKNAIEQINKIRAKLSEPELKKAESEYDPQDPETFYKSTCKNMGLPFENCVTATCFEYWVLNKVFNAGNDWRVVDSAFYKWSPMHKYWQHQSDTRVHTLVTRSTQDAFKLSYSKDFGWRTSKPYCTNNHSESAFKYARKHLEHPDPLPTTTHLISFNNCIVDLRTGEQMPHNKEHFITNIIPSEYQPGKECPEAFRQFIVESFGEDVLDAVRAFTSMFLDPTAPYGRFPHLIGQSGGGKGTLGRFWGNLFGEEGSGSGAQFGDISTPEGRHQYLTSKRIFGFPDIGGYAQGVRAFYELVDNGAMSGRALFNPVAYSKKWYMRFWAASVDHLQIENAGDGWMRRAYPIPVKSRIVKTDPTLQTRLEECKADVISWALAMPKEERDRILLSPPESERAINLALDAALYSDSTKSFVDLCIRPSASSIFVESHELHSWYVAYCKEHGYTPLGMSKFISHLKTVLPRNFQDRSWSSMVNGKRDRIPAHWKYLAPIPEVFVSSEKEDNRRDSGENPMPPSNPIWTCIKRNCSEGGLLDFEDFWQPKTPEPIHSQGVQGVQGTLEQIINPGQVETYIQSGCPPCPIVQSIDPTISRKNEDQKNIFDSTPEICEASNPVSQWTDWTPAPVLDSSLSTHPIETLDTSIQAGHPGHPRQMDVSAIPTSQITVGMRVRVVMPGSKRDGKAGRVKTIHNQIAKVLLDDASLGKLRTFECLIPGSDMQRLEILD